RRSSDQHAAGRARRSHPSGHLPLLPGLLPRSRSGVLQSVAGDVHRVERGDGGVVIERKGRNPRSRIGNSRGRSLAVLGAVLPVYIALGSDIALAQSGIVGRGYVAFDSRWPDDAFASIAH